ncbi:MULTISPECIES: DUF368 domain-containing protein [Turicibacter]|jgi:putative membrane protein|uniref:DUF368 domain-containing protein n=2 Tax=Turicibacter sanguinis TaxID=154288 RepID=A0A173R066_9FIRM|nr:MULTISPECIES: DUF368 domain-containing protein [Turicibacter]EFF63086.1 putative membrane protein [Turicibacter sanguinis PC909]EGC92743.1 putative membrane protein [Turicibacter sp. HGF1]MBP3903406.1 DUF368 domain-containing protein [Turicibacter sp.]MCU7190724.1 DUF368 domain-containing protein [Turicibacter sanguinis]MCU7196232.1 DUF368 domain-containing protein [Turicibacter sanguinis]
MFFVNLIRGFFMALADSVPGVSGGTIAFILGFYDQFIGSLNTLISKNNKEEKLKALNFLIKIGIGWAIGLIGSVLFLASIFEEHIYNISSLFIGFIIFSIPLIIKAERETLRNKYINLVWTVTGILIVVAISVFNPISSGGGINISLSNLNIGLIIYVFLAGMIAISAMVLPGISGSTLLLIFGLYTTIIGAIKEVLTFNFSYVPILFIFGIGIITGILSTIKLIRHALENARPQMIYLILGLMIGSIYAVLMGPTTLETPQLPMSFETFNLLYFIIGGAVIIGLEQFSAALERKQQR